MDSSRIPPCEVVGPDGTAIVVHLHRHTDRVGELADALGVGGSADVCVDGRPVDRGQLLVRSGLRRGSAVSVVDVAHRPTEPRDSSAPFEYAVLAGPACASWRALPAGRHVVGRSPTASIRIEDDSVEVHHGRVQLGAADAPTFVQLTGRTPVTFDTTVWPPGVESSGDPAHHGGGRRLLLGRSDVVVRPVQPAGSLDATIRSGRGGSTVPSDHDPWRRIVRRAPPEPAVGEPELPIVPRPPDGHRAPPVTGLIGAGIAAAGAALMAVVLGQVLFALFAFIGAVGSVATWAVSAVVAARGRRRAHDAYLAALEAFGTALARRREHIQHRHVVAHRSVVDALQLLQCDPGGVWSRRTEDGAVWATIGRGDVRYPVPIDAADRQSLPPERMAQIGSAEVLSDVPVPISLRPGSAIALHGDPALATALARALAIQIATFYGPADVRLVVITRQPQHWGWVDWLPHATRCIDVDAPAHVDELRDLADDLQRTATTVVVTDAADTLTARTGATRRMLVATRAACLVVTPADDTVPTVCDRVLEVGATGRLRWRGDDGSETGAFVSSSAHLSGITVEMADAAARGLAPLLDPETDDHATGLPSTVSLVDIGVPSNTSEIVSEWQRGGDDPSLAVTIGVAGDGTVEIDLVDDGPHALIAGTTGAGKSELLRTVIVGLAARISPDHVTFVLVDYKGGSTFDACARLPHVVGVVSDLEAGLAERALISLDAEVTRREHLLREVGADDLTSYREAGVGPLPRLVVMIDEFAGLARELPDFLAALVAIAQRGRSLGVHLVLATQRPAGVVSDDIRANTNLRLALRVQDDADARDVVGDDAPARFARSTPGRAALRLGADELLVFQAASCTGPLRPHASCLWVEPRAGRERPRVEDEPGPPTELETTVAAIADAALAAEIAAPHRPWIDPLPPMLTADLDHALGDAIGLVDDPQRQRRGPLEWDGAAGNLLLVGSLGSGTTTAAVAVAAALMRASTAADQHVYVLDGRGDPAWQAVAEREHCGALITVGETERLMRVLRRLADEIELRSAHGSSVPRVALLVDALGPFRAALGAAGLGEGAALLDRVLADGPAVGIVTCATTDGASSGALAMPAAQRWVFHVDDPGIARAAGLRGRVPSAETPGRLRIVESGLEAQVRRDPGLPDGPSDRSRGDVPEGGAPPVDVLPSMISPAELDRLPSSELRQSSRMASGNSTRSLVVGVSADTLNPFALQVPAGDHVFIGGAAGTGKSTALAQLSAAWKAQHADGRVVTLAPGGPTPGPTLAEAQGRMGGAPLLVVVDDADRVDDADGSLAALVAGRDPDVMVVAAARLEAVRVAYGHWVREVTRSRCGLIMTSAGEVDGDLLGAVLPRRTMIPPRPGLAWAIDGRGQQLVQLVARPWG